MRQIKILLVLIAGLTFLAATDPAFADQGCEGQYVIQRGDWLSKIAKRCDLTIEEILEANPQITRPDRILAGQVILLPVQNEVAALPETGVSNELVIADAPVISDSIPVEEAEETETYIVQPGDSLAKLSSHFGRSLWQMMAANPEIENPRLIFVGQQIKIPPADFRLLPPDEFLAQLEPGERWIDINLSMQMVYAYEGTELMREFVVSTGTWETPTVTGLYPIYVKFRYDDMKGPGYNLKDVPFVMYFYKGYGLHGTYWHNNFGTPMSHGCVNLRTEDAAWLYEFAEVGTLVNVHY